MKTLIKGMVFLVLFSHFQLQAVEFKKKTLIKESEISGRYSIGDLNNDGYDDIFYSGIRILPCRHDFTQPRCSHPLIDTLPKILINNQKGGFDALAQKHDITPPSSSAPYYSKIVDVNNDGINDLINSLGEIYLNDGTGKVELSYVINLPEEDTPIYSADVDNDGIEEILFYGSIYKRTQINSLAYGVIEQDLLWGSVHDIKLADVNQDGFVDIIRYGTELKMVIYINNQHGKFLNEDSVILDYVEQWGLVVGDIDNDDDIDLLLSDGRVLINQGNESTVGFTLEENRFDISVIRDSVDGIVPVQLVDYNGDEYLDIVVSFYQRVDEYRFDIYRSKGAYQSLSFSDLTMINDGQGGFVVEENSSDIRNGFLERNSHKILGFFDNDDIEDLLATSSVLSSGVGAFGSSFPFLFDVSPAARVYPIILPSHNNLLINDGFGQLKVTNNSMVNHSESFSFDFENDGVKEIIQTNYSLRFGLLGNIKNYPPYFLSNINKEVKINTLDDLAENNKTRSRDIVPADFNNDGLDDLLITTVNYINESAVERKKIVYLNSSQGFDRNNSIFVDNNNHKDVKILDINKDGYLDIVTSSKVYLSEEGVSFQNMPNNGNGFNSYVGDITGEGVEYFLGRNTTELDGVKLVYFDGNYNAVTKLLITRTGFKSFSFYDSDKDGKSELYVKVTNANKIEVYEYSDGIYSYNRSISINPTGDLSNMTIKDINQDGRVEIFSLNQGSLNVYQENQGHEFKLIFSEKIISDPELYPSFYGQMLFEDFDGDNFVDVFIGGRIFYYNEFNFSLGLNYDPNHNGHGFSIEPVGSLGEVYTVFYTYGNDGFPEWYSDLGIFEQPELDYWNINSTEGKSIRYQYDFGTSSATVNQEIPYQGNISHSLCDDNDSYISFNFELHYYPSSLTYLERSQWCSQPIVIDNQRPVNNVSGLWWAGINDSGWGWSMSLQERTDTTALVVVLYYYDAQGNPRWLLGVQEGFEFGQEINVGMNMFKGYARAATPVDLTTTAAGTMQFTINSPIGTNTYTGTMSMDVNYPGAEGGHWQRENIAISRQSNPRR